MPSWLKDILSGGSNFALAKAAWSWVMDIVKTLLGMSPQNYSPGAWTYVTQTIYPWFLAMGAVFLNMFCLIGFCRQASNLRDNITVEMWIELFIRVIIANTLMINGISIMGEFMTFSSALTNGVLGSELPEIYGSDTDLGFSLSMVLVGPIYLILTIVCAVTILIEVLSRFLNLYMLIAVSPLAMSTLAGGRGIENTSSAWLKSFLTAVFQIAVIALILQLSSHIIKSSVLNNAVSIDILGWFNGAGSVIMSLVSMVFMTVAIKGSDNFLKRAFDLR